MIICHLCLNGPYNDGWNYQENIMPKYHVLQGHTVFQLVTRYMWDGTKQVICNENEYVNSDGVNVIRLKEKRSLLWNKRFNRYPLVIDKLKKINPDILFIHDVQFVDIPKIVKFLENNPKCIAFADSHTDFSNSAKSWISRNILHKIIWKFFARKLVPVVKKFYGVLPARVDFLVNVYGLPKDKCELLVMGADDILVKSSGTKESIKTTRIEHGILDDDFLIITGGKIDSYKKQTLLLMQAVNNINKPNVKLIVFGSVAKELESEMKNNLSNNVQYIGWIDSKKTYNLFAAADLIVFPGRHSVFWEQACGQGKPLVVKYWDGTTHVDLGGNVKFLYKDSSVEIENVINEIIANNYKVFYDMRSIAKNLGIKYFSYNDISKRAIDNE